MVECPEFFTFVSSFLMGNAPNVNETQPLSNTHGATAGQQSHGDTLFIITFFILANGDARLGTLAAEPQPLYYALHLYTRIDKFCVMMNFMYQTDQAKRFLDSW